MLERNMTPVASFTRLSDDQLVARVTALATDERRVTVALIASLVEFDARRLYLREGCSSLFTYCTQALRLSSMRRTDGSKPPVPPSAFRSYWICSRKARSH